jgi:hypothetical protein
VQAIGDILLFQDGGTQQEPPSGRSRRTSRRASRWNVNGATGVTEEPPRILPGDDVLLVQTATTLLAVDL